MLPVGWSNVTVNAVKKSARPNMGIVSIANSGREFWVHLDPGTPWLGSSWLLEGDDDARLERIGDLPSRKPDASRTLCSARWLEVLGAYAKAGGKTLRQERSVSSAIDDTGDRSYPRWSFKAKVEVGDTLSGSGSFGAADGVSDPSRFAGCTRRSFPILKNPAISADRWKAWRALAVRLALTPRSRIFCSKPESGGSIVSLYSFTSAANSGTVRNASGEV
jgi:hypothetical protein